MNDIREKYENGWTLSALTGKSGDYAGPDTFECAVMDCEGWAAIDMTDVKADTVIGWVAPDGVERLRQFAKSQSGAWTDVSAEAYAALAGEVEGSP
tara:strand:- start:71 stop:358 length:288 start_codon:yes stop_codon:yes gene_type:complete